MSATPLLLSPIQVGSVELRNRIVSTAHGAFLDFYRPGVSGDRFVAYQERRAEGGTGLIVAQPVHVHHSSHALGHYVYDRDDLAPKLRQLADAVHRHGAKVLLQVMHFGAQFTSEAHEDLEPLWAFSPIVSAEGEPAHAMTPAEIEEVIEGFVSTCCLAVECGLDGVELHGAHGYLLQQSFSPWGNRRDDEWGEPLRFAREVLDRVRRALGPDPVVGLRISADDFMRPERGGLGPDGLRDVAAALVATRQLDYLNHSEGARSAHYARAVGSYRHPRGEFLPLTRGLREGIGAAVPVIGVGRIATPDLAEQALRDGICDLVGMTRAQIADPDLGRKLAAGRGDRIRPCVGANQGCVDRMYGGMAITCFHNPEVGRERRLRPLEPAAEPRRVLVVGGGPAGMKAAEIAARRGHQVTLCERSERLGGRLLAVRELGAAADLLAAVDWVERELGDLGVEIRLGAGIDDAYLAAAAPQVVVLATGARPALDTLTPTDGSVPVVSTWDAAHATFAGERVALAGEHVLLVDVLANLETALVAERLGDERAKVTIVTPYPQYGLHVGFTHRKDMLERLYELGCGIESSTVFAGTRDGLVTTRHVYSREISQRPFALVVAGVPGRPELELSAAAERLGARVLLAGDAVAPRTALHAFREGEAAGRSA